MNLFLKQLNLYLTKPVPTDVFKELKPVNYVSIFLVPKLVNTNTITRLLPFLIDYYTFVQIINLPQT